jgi:PAS domain S-box-containing protein
MKNEQHRRLGLQFKVAITATLALLTLAGALVYSYGKQMAVTADVELDKRAAAIITGLANECEYALLLGNKSLLQRAVVKALAQADVDSAVVFNEKGKVMAAAGHVDVMAKNKAGVDLVARWKDTGVSELGQNLPEISETYYLPVYLQPTSLADGVGTDELSTDNTKAVGEQLGLVELTVSVASMNRVVRSARAATLLIATILALVVSVLCILLVRRMVRPLYRLVEGTQELAAGNLSARVPAVTSDELGDLAHAFNDMADSLQLSRAKVLDQQRNLEQRVKDRTMELEQEITERKQTEEALRDSEVRYRTLFDNASEAVWLMTDTFLDCNQQACALWACTREDIIGHSPGEFSPPTQPDGRDSAEAARERIKAASSGQPQLFYWQHLRRDGDLIDAEISLTAVTLRGQRLVLAIGRDVTERKQAEAALEKLHKQLLDVSRQAGMAEVATNVLHNVGNVLNSVNVSSALVSEKIRESKVQNLAKAVALLREHEPDLAAFLTTDARGRQLCDYLESLARYLGKEQLEILKELGSLGANVEHIKQIVAMQQSYARASGVLEMLPIVDLVEDTLRMNAGALTRHHVQIIRDYAATPSVPVDKHKLLQILVNLVRNAKYALDEGGHNDKRLTIHIAEDGDNLVKISVMDNGVGIRPEHLTRIFEHGFTTRKDGHGFGLHSAAIAAKEMAGSLAVQSAGPGQGATFILSLPLHQEHKNQ